MIHPDVKFESQSPVIADVGTGTGIWLLDLAESLPQSTELWGFDIDLSQTPPREWLPENVHMEQLDIHDDVPDAFIAKFGQYWSGAFQATAPLHATMLTLLR